MYSSRRNEVKKRHATLKTEVTTAAKNAFHQSDNEELPKNPFNYTFDDLQVIEKERRSLLTRVKRFSLINISTSFNGTIFPDLFQSMFFWFNLLLYILVRILIKMEILTIGLELPQINTTLVSIVGGFMSFFLVFFVSQAYNRFFIQFDNSMRIEGRILNLAFLARNNLDAGEAWRFVRYINAVQVAGYTGLSHIYTEHNSFDTMNQRHQLLTELEVQRLKAIGVDAGGTAYREVLGWCFEILYQQFRCHKDVFDIISFQIMLNELMTLRGCIGTLYDYDDQQIPFVYVHLVFFLSMFYCPLISYTAAVYMPAKSYYLFPDILGFFVVFLNMIFVIGLREIGHAMNSPYEDSLQDLSVLHYMDFTVAATRKILAGTSMVSPGIDIEEDLENNRPGLGSAFAEHSVSTGGVRLNNYHANIHQHATSFYNGNNSSSCNEFLESSTKSDPDVVSMSRFGVYAPYLAGINHNTIPSTLSSATAHPHSTNNTMLHNQSNTIESQSSPSTTQNIHSSTASIMNYLQPFHHQPIDQVSASIASNTTLHPLPPTHITATIQHSEHDICSDKTSTGHSLNQGGVNHSHSFAEGIGLRHYFTGIHPPEDKTTALSSLLENPSSVVADKSRVFNCHSTANHTKHNEKSAVEEHKKHETTTTHQNTNSLRPSPPTTNPHFNNNSNNNSNTNSNNNNSMNTSAHITNTNTHSTNHSYTPAIFPHSLPPATTHHSAGQHPEKNHHAHIQTSPSVVSLSSMLGDDNNVEDAVTRSQETVATSLESPTNSNNVTPVHRTAAIVDTSSLPSVQTSIANKNSSSTSDKNNIGSASPRNTFPETRKRRSTRILNSEDEFALVADNNNSNTLVSSSSAAEEEKKN